MSDTLTHALDAAARGWHVFPVLALGKHPAVRWKDAATTDPQQVRRWLDGTELNYGIATEPSGLVILDEDTPGELERWATDRGITLPSTFTVATAHGAHYYYRRDGRDYSNRSPFTGDGYQVDVRGHGYVVGPGSVHETGTVYTITCDAEPVPLPAALHDYLTAPATPPPAPPRAVPPALSGTADAWTRRAIEGALQDLADTAALPEGATDRHGRTWETGALQARARRLVEVSNTAGEHYPRQQARADFEAAAPRGHEARFRHHFEDAELHVGDRPAERRGEAEAYRLTDEDRAAWTLTPPAAIPGEDAPAQAPSGPAAAPVDPFTPLDWSDVLDGPPPAEDWILWPLVERGQSVSLYSAPKQGKSLLVLDMLARACAGESTLGRPAAPPLRVLYIDGENTRRDLRRRLHDLGAAPEALASLIYLSFPPLAPLDTAKGAAQLHELVLQHRPDLVVIDTISRFIEGPENDADTWIKVYRHTLLPLKGQQVGVLRLDHTGKDAERGERGSSAKTGDVDASWSLTYDTARQTRTLTRKLTRTGGGPERLVLNIETAPLRHTPASPLDVSADPVAHLVRKLDELGAPYGPEDGIGRDRAAKLLREHGHGAFTKAQITEAVSRRKEAGYRPADLPAGSGQVPARAPLPTASGQVRAGTPITAGQRLPAGSGQALPEPPSQTCLPALPSIGGRARAGGPAAEEKALPQQLCEGCGEPLPDAATAEGHTTHPTCERNRT